MLIRTVVIVTFGLVSGLLLQACQPSFKSEPSCGFIQNVYGQRVSLNQDVPLQMVLHTSFPETYVPVLLEAMQVWEKEVGHKLFTLNPVRVGGPNESRRDNVNGLYWMNTWEKDKNKEQARTSIYWEGDEIREADVRINDYNFDFFVDAPQGKENEVHLKSLLIHELGHVLGLSHSNMPESVMQTYLADGAVRDQISAEDSRSAQCEY